MLSVLYCHKHVANSVGGGGACQYGLDKVIGGITWKLVASGEETTSPARRKKSYAHVTGRKTILR